MAQAPTPVRAPRAVVPPPTKDEAADLATQVNSMLNVANSLGIIMEIDVKNGEYDSPFVHPLYGILLKLDTLRGKKARRIAAYVRSERKNSRVRRVA